ncbi:MAG: hypothetical protein MZV49_24525 [Rhodopseudomonas palustris]|nr:hypothetical protein [Rhodopseudomonas palustris]
MPLDTPHNVLPFRPANDDRALVLTLVENNAFDELAQHHCQRGCKRRRRRRTGGRRAAGPSRAKCRLPLAEQPPAPTRRTSGISAARPAAVGVLLYRLDRLIHANPAFLTRNGFCQFRRAAGGRQASMRCWSRPTWRQPLRSMSARRHHHLAPGCRAPGAGDGAAARHHLGRRAGVGAGAVRRRAHRQRALALDRRQRALGRRPCQRRRTRRDPRRPADAIADVRCRRPITARNRATETPVRLSRR